ncbi:HoxN/HupN/NixA family nickel/cobalt transporter [Pectobacteriaceae bacterium CE90]|nr:HoxN/HupN/NixA family nickel/cobalt transporter [Pectobacteriaceae bacterium CE90]
MLSSLFRDNPRSMVMLGGLVMVNVLVWLLAWSLFHEHGALMATSLLAWCFGLRHAVDADHIAAIDNVTRKMMQEGKRPLSVGTWFSLGHSTIVILASLALAATATALRDDMAWFHEVGGVIGTLVSAGFLLLMALVNLVILRDVWKRFQLFKQGKGEAPDQMDAIPASGVMGWIFRSTFRLVRKSWHMYLVGLLFGLGFDTATEIGVLGISAAGASQGMSIWSIMIFPALFTCGMALVDTLDNVVMVGAYGWAFSKPQRKLYYNMTITATSVVVAVFIGGMEALGLLADKLDLHAGLWGVIEAFNAQLGNAGFYVVALFVACWVISLCNYRWKNYDALHNPTAEPSRQG